MNVAYYVLAFDHATDAVYETWGLGESYPELSGCAVFTLGMDVDYLAELFTNDPIIVTTQLLDWDYKRVHYYHRMVHAETDKLVAVNECLAMNVQLPKAIRIVPEALCQFLLEITLIKLPRNPRSKMGCETGKMLARVFRFDKCCTLRVTMFPGRNLQYKHSRHNRHFAFDSRFACG